MSEQIDRLDEIRAHLSISTPTTHDMGWALEEIKRQRHTIGRLEAWAKLWKRVAKLRRMWDIYNFRRARALRIECQQLVQLLTEVYADLDKHSALLPTRFGITQRLEELGLTWDDAEEVKGD